MFKDLVIKKALRKKLKSFKKIGGFRSGEINKIVCLADFDKVTNTDAFVELMDSYKIRPENGIILGYRCNSNETNFNGLPFFVKKEIDMKGRIRNYHADMIEDVQYDLLVNFFDFSCLPLSLLSLTVKAKLRVGISPVEELHNDICINCSIEESDIFSKEIKRILNTINR